MVTLSNRIRGAVMATYARPTIGIDADRLFFSGMAAAIAATIFAGFAPTYYLYPWLHGVTSRGVPGGASLTPLVHVHALVGSLWIILFITQVGLIARRRHDLHRKLGAASLFLAAALIVIGYLTAVDAARAGSSPPGWDDKAFLLIPLSSLVLFGSFVAAGALNRHRPDRHKRLMLLGTIALLLPALARLVRMIGAPFLPLGVLGGLLVLNLYIAALVAFDLMRLGKVHPVTIWGAVIFLLAWPARIWFGYTDAWQDIARILVS
jgi:uncharacterized membrane protein YhaH (DUF805 family)